MSPIAKRILKISCGIVAALFLILLAVLFNSGYNLAKAAYTVPPSDRRITQTPFEALGAGVIPVGFTNSEGDRVPGWYKEGTKHGCIILLHGLGGTRVQQASIARRFIEEGWGVLLIDQRGHGEHPQRLTTFGRAESQDALAAINWLRQREEIDPERIGLYGASMGATTVIYAASMDPDIACAVADSSYADFRNQAFDDLKMDKAFVKVSETLQPLLLKAFFLVSHLVIGKWAKYPNPVEVIVDIECPLFLIHGENDERIYPENFHDLSWAASQAGVDLTAWFVRGEGHCSYLGSDEYRNRIVGFFREHLDSPD